MSDELTQTGLKFFGAMTASISHELKNRFAIINEQAGLLTDLVHMSEKSGPIAPERLERLAGAVKKQVGLADDLLKHMNRFSHSVDQIRGETDISLVLACTVALSRRPADMRNVSLELRLPDTPAMAHTSTFWLMNLMWILLDATMGPAATARQVTISCESSPEGVLIKIAGIADVVAMTGAVAAVSDLATELQVQVTHRAEQQSVSLLLPA
ncbi:MAG: sensor histidine kinase [Pseudomonadota bacterium]